MLKLMKDHKKQINRTHKKGGNPRGQDCWKKNKIKLLDIQTNIFKSLKPQIKASLKHL